MAIEFIRHHVNNLPPGQIFTSREVLIYGTRSAVDSAIRTMVFKEEIYRLARGIFIQKDSGEPSMAEIVEAKLKGYRSKSTTNAEAVLHRLSLYPFGNSNTFAKNGSSSSFWTVRGRAYLQNICERKMSLCQAIVGQLIYALWWLNTHKVRLSSRNVYDAFKNLGRVERRVLWLASSLMPAWLSKLCEPLYPRRHYVPDNPFQAPVS